MSCRKDHVIERFVAKHLKAIASQRGLVPGGAYLGRSGCIYLESTTDARSVIFLRFLGRGCTSQKRWEESQEDGKGDREKSKARSRSLWGGLT